ncbi:ABC transporter substrate-binding protein [Pseudomonas sp. BIGb0427]|uniref:ABC transporter substrate-binding protein n=1 Tax=unclassified Pseudomonas TaxID=196821 RepID=UPI0018A76B51|nr:MULTISPECIES: ABC transporter substrate-binding protein [unclassified Pseudomonas]QPG60988.1 ABC transporter substrate-binding protein [Pseudomonas sp. BIGb0427]UVM68595.1 ABC transporter substrate-binding protein [Pseudomonas sp. B21-009]
MRGLGASVLALLSSSAMALDYQNCGHTWQLPQERPQRILALNQHAADLLLALGAGPALAAVSYIDDDAQALTSGRYRGVPLLSRRYPATEVVYAQGYDLLVGGFASAFRDRDGVAPRTTLQANGIASYLLENACAPAPENGFAAIEQDLRSLGHLLQREARASQLITRQRQDLATAKTIAGHSPPLSVFYLDSEVNGLQSEGKRGFITQLIDAAGGRNLYAEVELNRVTVDAERLLRADPDVIILADAVWSPAAGKRAYLRQHPALSHLRAVRDDRLIDLPFSHIVPGEHSARTALTLARQLLALKQQRP